MWYNEKQLGGKMIKLCKDCKWYKKDWITHLMERSDRFDKCLSPALNENLVTGKSNGYYCDTTRRFHKCGMEGKLWEARK